MLMKLRTIPTLTGAAISDAATDYAWAAEEQKQYEHDAEERMREERREYAEKSLCLSFIDEPMRGVDRAETTREMLSVHASDNDESFDDLLNCCAAVLSANQTEALAAAKRIQARFGDAVAAGRV